MSYSTRCVSRRSDLAVLACGVLVCSLALADSANPALNTASLGSTSEPDIEVVLPGARVVGQRLLRYWGIPVYHARLFFAIWLAPTTSEPGLRQALLGLDASTQNP